MSEATFAPSLFSVLFAGLNFVLFVLIVIGIVWVVRRLRLVLSLERRVAALEARLDSPDRR